MGIYANPAGYKRAKAEAIALGGAIATRSFSWESYLKPETIVPKLVRDWVKEFEQAYFNRRARTPKSETTWDKDYRLTFTRLDPSAPLTAELLLKTISNTQPDSRQRRRFCMALGQLAKFAEIDVDVSVLSGSYSAFNTQPRDIPEDELIEEFREQITNPAWQWVYGVIAVYGLRPHEPFNLDLERMRRFEKILTVEDGKTGYRQVWPFPLRWWEEWKLWEVQIPDVTAKNNSGYGNRVQQYFKRANIPFHAYDLRHAWSIRTLRLGLDLTLAARQQGHSVTIHTQIYHKWITEKVHQEAYERLMGKF